MTYYLIDADGFLVNTVRWDGVAEIDFGVGITAIRADSVETSPKMRVQDIES